MSSRTNIHILKYHITVRMAIHTIQHKKNTHSNIKTNTIIICIGQFQRANPDLLSHLFNSRHPSERPSVPPTPPPRSRHHNRTGTTPQPTLQVSQCFTWFGLLQARIISPPPLPPTSTRKTMVPEASDFARFPAMVLSQCKWGKDSM